MAFYKGKELNISDTCDRIKKAHKEINKLNKQRPIQDTEQVFGVYDDSSENLFFCEAEEKWFKNKNLVEEKLISVKKQLKDTMNSVNLIKEGDGMIFKVKVKKILSYNQTNKFTMKKVNTYDSYGTPITKEVMEWSQTKLGSDYQYEIAQEVSRLMIKDNVKPKPTKYRLTVEAFVNYAQKDVDGLKVFVDYLVRALGEGDRKLYDDSQFLNVDIFIPKVLKREQDEFFLIKFTEVNENIMSNKSMYSEYVAQKIDRIRKEKKEKPL